MENKGTHGTGTYAGSEILSCGVIKNENFDVHFDEPDCFDNLSKKSENISIQKETILHSPPLKNEDGHFFGTIKQEELDVKYNAITFQEENHPDSADNLHVMIPLSFETARQSSTRKRVMKNISSKDEECFKCNSCSYKCSFRSRLIQHLRIHTGEKPYKCNSCSYECSQLSNLNNHKRIHTGEKPYKCSSCSYECSHLSTLNNHIRIHTGEKPYKCNSCSYESSFRSSLIIHLRSHSSEKPFKCSSCSFMSFQNYHLKRHLKVHSTDKPYKCNSCLYECSYLSNLKRHLRIHAGENA